MSLATRWLVPCWAAELLTTIGVAVAVVATTLGTEVRTCTPGVTGVPGVGGPSTCLVAGIWWMVTLGGTVVLEDGTVAPGE